LAHNGKLLKISLEYDENKNLINNIKISGDFFAYPEEGIELIEKELKDIYLNEEYLKKKIDEIIKKRKIQFIGVDIDSIIKGILMCKK